MQTYDVERRSARHLGCDMRDVTCEMRACELLTLQHAGDDEDAEDDDDDDDDVLVVDHDHVMMRMMRRGLPEAVLSVYCVLQILRDHQHHNHHHHPNSHVRTFLRHKQQQLIRMCLRLSANTLHADHPSRIAK